MKAAPRGAVIFDLDGTLIDSAPDIHAAGNVVLAEEGCAPIDLATARGFVGNGVHAFVERLRGAAGLAPDPVRDARMLARFEELYRSAVDLTTIYPGAVEALEALREAGWRLGLCTNKPEAPARAVMAHLGLLGRFDTLIGGDSLSTRKPDPAPLHACLRALGARDAIYVGDSEVDSETATAACVPFALFTEGYRKRAVDELAHAARFDRHAHLPGIIERLSRSAG
ncbi:phosphoglycolate phosphatase [Rhodobacteraceae bacterium WD3A24]|nr:phosphoglycolate phosphatase [Rhodobacteraceae bacterium WD3A24]